jgi:hypothetical protein
MTLKTAKKIWDFLKQDCEENKRIEEMQVLNLIKEFDMQKMKTTKKYNERLLGIVNNVRLIGTVFFILELFERSWSQFLKCLRL